jgi:hypothetical protein
MKEDSIERPSYYTIMPANVRYDKRLSLGAKILYGEIHMLTRQKGYCWATNKYFALMYDWSKKTISRHISDLEKYGYITSKVIYVADSKEIASREIRMVHPDSIPDNPMNHPPPMDKSAGAPMDTSVRGYGQECPG